MIVGIDAGGTSVRIAIADRVTGAIRAQAQDAADADGGPDAALRLWNAMRVRDAAPPASVASVCAGITKITRTGVRERWENALTATFPGASVRVVPDYVTAFHGAIPGGRGIIVIAGTGSVAYGEDGAGAAVRVGGRGWEYGDEGAGSHLTTEIMRRALRMLDGMAPPTPLNDALCALLATRDPAALGEIARQRSEIEGRGFLIPFLLRRAHEGDPEAINLFTGAAGWLAALVRAVHARLGFAPTDPISLSPLGGLWEAGDLIRLPFQHLLTRWLPAATLSPPDAPAVIGATRLGYGVIDDGVMG